MKIEDIKSLLEEIEPDKEGNGYIDCGTGTNYTDNHQYKRIIAAIKQNIALQQENEELIKKLEEVEKQGMESLLQVEKLTKIQSGNVAVINNLVHGIQEGLLDIYAGKENEIRIGDFIFKVRKDHVDFTFEPIKTVEPIEVKIKITENSDKSKVCPICNKKIGKYPAISRKDNKTEICSNCGTLEAIAAFEESVKDEKTNEKDI